MPPLPECSKGLSLQAGLGFGCIPTPLVSGIAEGLTIPVDTTNGPQRFYSVRMEIMGRFSPPGVLPHARSQD